MKDQLIAKGIIWFTLEMILMTEGVTTKMVITSLCLFVLFEISLLTKGIFSYLSFAGGFLTCFLLTSGRERLELGIILLLSCLILFFLWENENLKRNSYQKADQSRELEMKLRKQNRALILEQNNEIHLATMKERTRIAREIHDHVGHLLSRSLILLGAIRTISKDELVNQKMDLLDQTLDQAMKQMRQSVNDLRDDSIDLEGNIKDCVAKLENTGNCQVVLDVDPDLTMEKDIKMAIIAILREATSNYIKHSRGDRVRITIHEHPGFLCLSVEDNGSLTLEEIQKLQSGLLEESGIGLSNIKERARALGGHAEFMTEGGFTVFVNLPKNRKE